MVGLQPLSLSQRWKAPDNKQKLGMLMAGMGLMLIRREPGNARSQKLQFIVKQEILCLSGKILPCLVYPM